MPTYGYECTSCGHGFELFQKITAEPAKNCPKCGNRVRRLIGGGAGIIFKGSGFYTTDYKKSSTSAGNGSSADQKKDSKESSGESAKSSSSESKKETSKKDP